MCDIKQKLLQTGEFVDNEYLDEYINLIKTNKVNYIKGKTNAHHIIPKYYYRDNGLSIDNSINNIVNLYYEHHILAHYYLAMCSTSKRNKARNALAIKFILNGVSIDDIDINDINLDKFQHMYELGRKYNIDSTHTPEVNNKISEKLCGRKSPNKGNKQDKPKKSKKNPNAKNKVLSEIASTRLGDKNPFYGKVHNEETKKMISKANSKRVAMIDLESNIVIKEFDSIKQASDYLKQHNIINCQSASCRISRVCRCDNEHKAYGYNWRFI